jgi:hypothetical protein
MRRAMACVVRSASVRGRLYKETTYWLTLDQHGPALQSTERIQKAEGSHTVHFPPYRCENTFRGNTRVMNSSSKGGAGGTGNMRRGIR